MFSLRARVKEHLRLEGFFGRVLLAWYLEGSSEFALGEQIKAPIPMGGGQSDSKVLLLEIHCNYENENSVDRPLTDQFFMGKVLVSSNRDEAPRLSTLIAPGMDPGMH